MGENGEFRDPKGFYKKLGVNPSNTTTQIAAEYHVLSLSHHPDKIKEPATSQAFINEAYNVLGNSKRRTIYDRYRLLNVDIPWEEFEREWSCRISHWIDQEQNRLISESESSGPKKEVNPSNKEQDERLIEELFKRHKI
jgi:DnaJ-class molecular chaperone